VRIARPVRRGGPGKRPGENPEPRPGSTPYCAQKPTHCQAHHLIPRAKGGATALHNLALLCSFHHLIAVHRWGWTLALNPDGTTTATSPGRRKILHSHGPPGGEAAA
jgi:5-methylcytosine-specific restriction endonuclease McrA